MIMRILGKSETRSTLCLKKVPTLNSLQLCQILTDFQNFSLLESVWNLLQNAWDNIHHTLGMLLHYLMKLKNQIFCRYWEIIPDMKANADKLHLKCTGFNSSTCVTVQAECNYVFLSESSPRRWTPCCSLTNTAVTSAVTNCQCHKLIAKVNK